LLRHVSQRLPSASLTYGAPPASSVGDERSAAFTAAPALDVSPRSPGGGANPHPPACGKLDLDNASLLWKTKSQMD